MPAPKDPIKYNEWREKLKIVNTGKRFTRDHCKKISKSAKIRMQSKEERDKYSIANIGKLQTKEHTQKRIVSMKKNNLERKKEGKLKKRWKLSVATRKKMSAAKIGLNHPLYGKHHSLDTIKKMSETNKLVMSLDSVREKISNSLKGINCYLWKGGISYLPYCFKFNKRRRKAVRIFFGYFCICCGKHVTENIIRRFGQVEHSVHHVDHDKEQGCNGKPFNLVPLCAECHSKESHHEQEYKDYINKTLEEGFKWGIWSREQYEIVVMYPE
jgi:hypothetical protein